MLLVVISAIIGGIGTFSLMLPNGLLAAFLSAPLGGSVLALLAAVYLAFLRVKPSRRWQSSQASRPI